MSESDDTKSVNSENSYESEVFLETLDDNFLQIFEDLATNLSNLTIDMADPVPQTISVKTAMECIPRFDGKNLDIRDFIKACKAARRLVPTFPEATFIIFITTKLFGNAATVVSEQNYETLNDLYASLTRIFGEFKSSNSLQGELATLRQTSNETVSEFGCRVIDILNALTEKTAIENDAAVAQVLTIHYQNTAVTSFVRGLKRDIESRAPKHDSSCN